MKKIKRKKVKKTKIRKQKEKRKIQAKRMIREKFKETVNGKVKETKWVEMNDERRKKRKIKKFMTKMKKGGKK